MSRWIVGVDDVRYIDSVVIMFSDGSEKSVGGKLVSWSSAKVVTRERSGLWTHYASGGSSGSYRANWDDHPEESGEASSSSGSVVITLIVIIIGLVCYYNPQAAKNFIKDVTTTSSTKN